MEIENVEFNFSNIRCFDGESLCFGIWKISMTFIDGKRSDNWKVLHKIVKGIGL